MNIGVGIFNLLAQAPSVNSVVQTRVFPGFVPQDAQFPAIVYSLPIWEPILAKGMPYAAQEIGLDVFIMHRDYGQAHELAESVKTLIGYHSGEAYGVPFKRIQWEAQYEEKPEMLYEMHVIRQEYKITI
jgi:hypothetical protein